MASRAFSTRTTEDVTWLTESVDELVENVPGLEDVDSGQVNGNPHPTPSKNDPYHGTVELYRAGAKVTSVHIYPNGYAKFSKEKKYPAYKGAPHPKAPVFPPSGPATSKTDSKPDEKSPQSKNK